MNKTLKVIRKEKKLTQQEVADGLGVAAAAVCNYESGARELRASIIPTYALILSISIEELVLAEIATLSDSRT